MRSLAGIGLVAVLALLAWSVVQGVRMLPHTGEGLTAVVASLQSYFHRAPMESLLFDLNSRTLTAGQTTSLQWSYVGTDTPSTYQFSYQCDTGVALSIKVPNGWHDQPCGTPITLTTNTVEVIPTSPTSRFADVELVIETSALRDTTLATVINTDLSTSTLSHLDEAVGSTSTPSSITHATETTQVAPVSPTAPVPAAPTPRVPVPVVTQPVVTSGPSDLVVNIADTGVVVPVEGLDTFFPLSPLPRDKIAAVKFTVTNRGSSPSGIWAFRASLPIEGNATYAYVSPAQNSLAPGMEVEFTLSFDKIIDASSGVIRIEVVPTAANDATSNNIDATTVHIAR
jgi:hypothetical protein